MKRHSPPSRRQAARAALFWAALHLRRILRRRGSILAVLVLWIAAGLLRWVADEPGSDSARILLIYPTPLLALFFASGALREEIEDRTLTYAFTRPAPRAWIYYARVAAHLGPLLLAILPALALVAGDLSELGRFLAAGLAASLAFGGLFALFGVLSRGAAWLGLAFMVWEHGALRVPGFIQDLSLLAHVHGLAGVRVDAGILTAGLAMPGPVTAVAVLGAVAVVTLVIGGGLVARREVSLAR